MILTNAPESPYQLAKAEHSKVLLTKEGEVFFDPPGRISALCYASLTRFPLDTQICSFRFESWTQPSESLLITLAGQSNFGIVNSLWREHPGWSLIDNWTNVGTVGYTPNSPTVYSYVLFTLHLRRKVSAGHVALFILPSLVLHVALFTAILLPPGKMAKLCIAVVCIPTYAVIQALFLSQWPPGGERPILITCIEFQMAIGVCSVLISETVVWILTEQAKQNKPVPLRLTRLFRFLAKLALLQTHSKPPTPPAPQTVAAIVDDPNSVEFLPSSPLSTPSPVFVTFRDHRQQQNHRPPRPQTLLCDATTPTFIGRGGGGDGNHQLWRPIDSRKPFALDILAKRFYEDWIFCARVVSRISVVFFISFVVISTAFCFIVLFLL